MRKIKKSALLVLLGGTMFFGSCLGGLGWKQVAWTAAVSVGTQFLTDNNGVFDLFDDGSTEAAANP